MPASSDPSDFCESDTHGLRASAPGIVAVGHTRDDHVAHLDDEELLLALARFPMGDRRFLDVHTRSAPSQQERRRLVDAVRKGELLEPRLALPGSASATAGSGT